MRLVAASTDDVADAARAAADFPNLTFLADREGTLLAALEAFDTARGPGGIPLAAPTLLLLDGSGIVRHVFRPDRFVERLHPDQLLAVVRRLREQ